MTAKERLLRSIRGQETDRLPWSPFLAYWWEHQPQALTGLGQLAYMESVGADPLLRGFSAPWQLRYEGVEIRSTWGEDSSHEVWSTPVGQLHFGRRRSVSGNTWFLTDHPVKTAEDLKVLQWVYEHTTVEPSAAADDGWAETGERGLYLPLIGCETKTCFQSLVEKWVGTETLVYLLQDEQEAVESCLAAMRQVSDRTAEYCAGSKAEGFIFWEDSSTTNITPAMFRAFAAPEISFWADTLHGAGKLLVHHACGHLKALLPHMAAAGVDAIESISPPPTGNIDIGQAFSLLPENVALIGGIEPVFLQNCTARELEERLEQLFAMASGRRYVLANSDSCPPGVEAWKFKYISDFLRKDRTAVQTI